MKNSPITITSLETMILVHKTYEFIASQFKMTDEDIKLIALTLAEIIDKNKMLKE